MIREFAFFRSLLPLTVLLTGQMTVNTPAFADGGDSSFQQTAELQPIIVTAQKRSEKLQDIPIAATALTATDLERAAVNNIQDVAALTPNLVIIDQLRPGIQTVSFRGFTTVQGGQSPFAILVDGVEQPGQEFLKQQLVDVQQVEVLRGPQGTLYGQNAVAGAINVVSKAPTNDFEASIKLGIAQGNQQTGTLTVSGPIIADTVFFRASAYSDTFNGLIPNPATNIDVDFINERSFNGELLIKPTDRLDIDLRGHATNGSYGALWLTLVTNAEFDSFNIGPNENIPGIDTRHLQTFSGKIDYRFDNFTITSITAYNDAKQYATADGDFTAASIFGQTWLHNTNAWSEELRLTSTMSGALKWNLGAFAQDYAIRDSTTFFSENPASPFDSVADDHYRNKSWAVFGQTSYEFAPGWTSTVGARYDRVQSGLNDVVNNIQDEHNFSAFQPKATLAYQFTPDIQAYATYSKGFRPGGFNPATPLSIRLYENEVSTNYELGLKSTFLDNRLLVDAAAFHTKFVNQQFFFSQATTSGIYTAIINIPVTNVNGAEVEAQYKPIDWLRFIPSIGYNKTKIEHFQVASLDGNRTPQVYGFTGDLATEVVHSVGGGLTAVGRLDYQHRGDVYWDLANDLRTPPKNFMNLRLALERADQLWSVALVGHNITNERTPAAVGANAFGAGETLRSANEPRQWGLELRAKF